MPLIHIHFFRIRGLMNPLRRQGDNRRIIENASVKARDVENIVAIHLMYPVGGRAQFGQK